MDPAAKYVLVATVIVATLIMMALLSHFVLQRRAKTARTGNYTVVSPATPLAKDAMGKVLTDIALICSYGEAFLCASQAADTTGARPTAVPVIEAARAPVRALTLVLRAAETNIKRAPPSQSNYAQIYRALSGSDNPVRQSAASYVGAGRAASQHIAETPGSADALYYTVAGDALGKLGNQIRALIVSVHNLGVALDLE